MAAAVSDYVPAHPQQGKLKKEALGAQWSLELKQNSDLIATADKTGIKTVAFKAEFDETNALDNAITFITNDSEKVLPRSGKLALSLALLRITSYNVCYTKLLRITDVVRNVNQAG